LGKASSSASRLMSWTSGSSNSESVSDSESMPPRASTRVTWRAIERRMRSAHCGRGVVGGRLVSYQSWLVGVAERRISVYSGSGGL
jgi:hypothetical protein